MGIGESVVWQDQKIALCQASVLLILKGKHIWCKEERKSLLRDQQDFSIAILSFAEKLQKPVFFSLFNSQRCSLPQLHVSTDLKF